MPLSLSLLGAQVTAAHRTLWKGKWGEGVNSCRKIKADRDTEKWKQLVVSVLPYSSAELTVSLFTMAI